MYGLIFDVDGVLADTERLSEQASIKMFRELYGAELKPEAFHPYIGTGAVRYVQGPADDHGMVIDIDHAVAERHENFVAMLASGQAIDFPGANALIARVAEEQDWKLAIATSSPGEKAKATFKAARINLDLFTSVIHGDLVTRKKPDPEIYITTAKALELPPDKCVVVEDAITGLQSAKAAGMHCLAVTNSFSAEKLAGADVIVNSLEAVTLEMLRDMVA